MGRSQAITTLDSAWLFRVPSQDADLPVLQEMELVKIGKNDRSAKFAKFAKFASCASCAFALLTVLQQMRLITGLVGLRSQLWRFSCISTTCRPVKPIKIFGIQVQEDPWCGAQESHHCFLTGLHTDMSWTEGRTASSTRRMHTRQAACQRGRTWTIHVLAANLW